MTNSIHLDAKSKELNYDPNHLLNTIIKNLHLKNDAALSRALEVAPPVISKIRHRHLAVGATLLIRMNEISGIEIKELRKLMGDKRKKFLNHELSSNIDTEQPAANEFRNGVAVQLSV
ncbi:hypothetical protein ACO0KY_08420 [Undibacterium sp. Dicai25W]|uniref:hypothetical protein n=1 Tax=Undibacterium sp. Dicai25W TaxID=3413034 RepID=UPI003BF05BAC